MPEANKFEIGLLQLLKSKVQTLPIVPPVKDSKRKELRRLSSWADYMSTREAGEIWGYSMQGVARLCALGRVQGAGKVGHGWIIPRDAPMPPDARVTTGRWVGYKPKYRREQIGIDIYMAADELP